jgi:5-methylcytosine-specific restriction endonuclease McrA
MSQIKTIGYYENNHNYTIKEIEIIKNYYPISTKNELMEMLPNRNYCGIKSFASRNKIRKTKECDKKCRSVSQKGKKLSEQFKLDCSIKMKKVMENPENRIRISNKLRKETYKIALSLRQCFKYRKWREEIYNRDNWTCQECGIRGGKLHAHHKIRFADLIIENKIQSFEQGFNCLKLWNINDGITLCVKCHRKTENYGNKQKVAA